MPSWREVFSCSDARFPQHWPTGRADYHDDNTWWSGALALEDRFVGLWPSANVKRSGSAQLAFDVGIETHTCGRKLAGLTSSFRAPHKGRYELVEVTYGDSPGTNPLRSKTAVLGIIGGQYRQTCRRRSEAFSRGVTLVLYRDALRGNQFSLIPLWLVAEPAGRWRLATIGAASDLPTMIGWPHRVCCIRRPRWFQMAWWFFRRAVQRWRAYASSCS